MSYYNSWWEYDIDDQPDELQWESRDRAAETRMILRTGGKELPHQRNLFAIWATAGGVLSPGSEDPNAPTWPLEPDEITIGSLGKPGADYYLYKVLPNDATNDVTPKVSGLSHYVFDVRATKHTLVIRANSVDLAPDKVVVTNCVGQKMNLTSLMTPSIDSHLESLQAEWAFPNIWVNSIVSRPYGAKLYNKDWTLTHQQDTYAWWVTGGEKHIRCDWSMTFRNGQTAKVYAMGRMNMHRPSVTFTDSPPYFAFISTNLTTPVLGRPFLLLGADGGQTPGSMGFTVQVHSDFAGVSQWTQLINEFREWDEYPAGVLWHTTGGEDWADQGEFFFPNNLHATNSPGDTTFLGFGDQPGNPVGVSRIKINDRFKTYLRYLPTGSESIWVTLRRIDWGWEADAVNTSDWYHHTIPSSWTITFDRVTGPIPHDVTEFPFWPGVTVGTPDLQ